ncbi:MAG: LacI family transcriptional regulator [Treponema sp.]|jgi:LacI family transcriptional regulator|nr:LacI family transcriptional regulator [Treponema sp.]
MITIKKIAQFAGVSTTTVSNVIHGKRNKISPGTFDHINSLLQKHRYVEKLGLRHLNNSRSQIICLVINSTKKFEHTVYMDPFYSQITGMVEKILHEKNYYLMIYVSMDVQEIFRTVAAWNIDGIIAVSFRSADCSTLTELTGKPVAAIDVRWEHGEQNDSFVNIGSADFEGGYSMTRHLIHAGYRAIWIFASQDIGVDHERSLGYKKALREADIPYRSQRYVMIGENREERIALYQKLLPLWKTGKHALEKSTHKKTALFFFSDFYAIEAIAFLSESGVPIPSAIGVAGYDDIPYAAVTVPALSTVRQNISEKAALAVEYLFRLMNGERPANRDLRLPVELVIRKSL